MMSLYNRLLSSPVVEEKVIIGDFRIDIENDRQAEKIVRAEFPEIEIITSVEGNKLIPVASLLKLSERLKEEDKQRRLTFAEEANNAAKNGYQEGYRDGLKKGHQEAQKVIDNFASLIQSAVGQRENLYRDAHRKIVDLVLEIARKVTFDAARIDPEVTAGIISGVIGKLVDKSNIKVKVHPDHFPVIQQQIDRFAGDSDAIRGVNIEPDPKVRHGGCYIETPTGDIDARVESQMNIIANSLENTDGDL